MIKIENFLSCIIKVNTRYLAPSNSLLKGNQNKKKEEDQTEIFISISSWDVIFFDLHNCKEYLVFFQNKVIWFTIQYECTYIQLATLLWGSLSYFWITVLSICPLFPISVHCLFAEIVRHSTHLFQCKSTEDLIINFIFYYF